MRHAVGVVVALFVLGTSVALAATTSDAARPVSLFQALQRTTRVTTQRYTMRVTISRAKGPTTLDVRGRSGPGLLSVHVGMSKVTLADGTRVPGPDGAALLDGPFLYLRAPSSISVYGGVRWLRERVATLSPASPALHSLRDMSPAPLLRVVGESRATASGPSRVFYGSVAYDDPIVRNALRHLTGGLEFRALELTAWIGRDGLVHRILLQGSTADRSAALRLTARLFAFGRPVTVTPPKEGTFMDKQLVGLQE